MTMDKISLDNPFFSFEGKEVCVENMALARLLIDDIVFVNELSGETTVIFVIANDIFAWGCSDAESLLNDEIPDLYKMHMANKEWGAAKWCCLKRKQKPQPRVEKAMRDSGAWDDAMEALPANTMDAEISAIFSPAKAG